MIFERWDLTNFAKMLEPFKEDGAISEVYIGDNNDDRRSKYKMLILAIDLEEYGECIDVACGEVPLDVNFGLMLESVLRICNRDLGLVTTSEVVYSKENINESWSKLI